MATYNGHQEDSSGNILLPISNSMASTIETGSTASQAYTKGSYFYYNNRLVKASTAIASGATLTIGSNIAYVNTADEISAHLRANDANKSEFYFDVKDGSYGYYPSASKVASEFVPFGGASLRGTPTMTSDTTPSGQVLWDSSHTVNGTSWKAFDKTASSSSYFKDRSANGYIGYKFTSAVKVQFVKVNMSLTKGSSNVTKHSWKIEASSNGSTWNTIKEFDTPGTTASYIFGDYLIPVETSTAYQYWRLFSAIAMQYADSWSIEIRELDFLY